MHKTNKLYVFLGAILTLFTLFGLLSLITHHPADYGNSVYPPNQTLVNKGGMTGAFVAHHLYLFFGIVAYLLLGAGTILGVCLLLRRPIASLGIKIIALALCLLSCLMLGGLITPDNFTEWSLSRNMESFSGFVGYNLAIFFQHALGTLGSYLLALFILGSTLLLLTNWRIYDVGLRLLQNIISLLISSVKTVVAFISTFRSKYSKQTIPAPALTPSLPKPSSGNLIREPQEPGTTRVKTRQTRTVSSKQDTQPTFDISSFTLPDVTLLEDATADSQQPDDKDTQECVSVIESTLKSFGVEARVVTVERGPVITKYEIELGPGISVHKVAGMADDLSIALKAPSVRIVAPIPGKSTVGIEVPNAFKGIVRLKELITLENLDLNELSLPLFLGKDAAGQPVIQDLDEMPHLLIAGTTGSGKSICISSIILSLLMVKTPAELKFILIDPKMVELSTFKDIPHLLSPVVTDMRRATVVLNWLVRTMNERYELFLRAGVKRIDTYNQLSEAKIRERLTEDGEEPADVPLRLPYIVVIIDELADLMMAASDEVETAITRLAQKSRAVGLHLVLATQRPSVDVITGLIKSNMPTRIAFKVASKVDSRTILDRNGAEKLLGQGDMLLVLPGSTDILRSQCTFISDNETRNMVNFLKEQGPPIYNNELLQIENKQNLEEMEEDEYFEDAIRIILETKRGSVSLLQRRLGIGYSRAARLIEMMAQVGIVGAYKGSKAREVLMNQEEWEAHKAR
ncbi:DNA translocase FtsK 4TM domain-containing protein [Planctomycetota bacterium]